MDEENTGVAPADDAAAPVADDVASTEAPTEEEAPGTDAPAAEETPAA